MAVVEGHTKVPNLESVFFFEMDIVCNYCPWQGRTKTRHRFTEPPILRNYVEPPRHMTISEPGEPLFGHSAVEKCGVLGADGGN